MFDDPQRDETPEWGVGLLLQVRQRVAFRSVPRASSRAAASADTLPSKRRSRASILVSDCRASSMRRSSTWRPDGRECLTV
jgi:hypothetical protein